ncbi:MAG: hypothetical protein PWP74_1576 [Shewanella sp.]|nr:hypothetical protein [Shewanella sp.]
MILSRLKGMVAAYRKAPKLLKIAGWLSIIYLCYAFLLGVITPAVVRAVAPEKLTQLLGRQVSVHDLKINPFLLRVQLDNLVIAGKSAPPLLELTHADAEFNLWQSLFNRAWCVDHLQLTGLTGQVIRTTDAKGNFSFNFDDIIARFQNPAPTQTTSQTDNAPLPDFRIQTLALSNSNLQFSDTTAKANLSYHNINFTVHNFGTRNTLVKDNVENQPNQYRLSFNGQDQGTLTTDGQLLLQPLQIKGQLQLNNITLPPFWGYVQPMLQAQLADGAVSLKTHYVLSQAPDQPLSYRLDNTFVTVSNVQFTDGKTPVVKLATLRLNNIVLTSQQQQVNIADVTVDGLWMQSRFDQHGLALLPLFIPNTTEPAPPATTSVQHTSTPKWQVKLAAFNLKNADINVHEQQLSDGVDWRVYPLMLQTGNIDSQLTTPLSYQMSLDISQNNATESGGNFSSEGSIDLSAKQATGKLTLSKLQLNQLQPYLVHYLNIELPKGEISSSGDFSADAAGHASYKGNVDLSDLEIRDLQQRRPLLKWQQLAIDSVDFDANKRQLALGNVTLEKPYAKVTINEDRSTNIGKLLVKQAPATPDDTEIKTTAEIVAAAPTTAEAGAVTPKPLQITVASINVNNGSAYFADNSLTPNFATGIEQLHGKISSLSSVPGTKASVDIAGKIDRYAPMSLKGEINPLLQQPYLDLKLLFKSVELTTVNPYSGTYAGYYIDKGQLTLSLNYQLQNNQLKGNNHVVIDQLKLGKPTDSKLATSLPVTLAIALLQDRHGVIDLGLPVSGDLDNPDFSFGGIILSALTNVITKAVTAPFSFLANLLGSDEELNLVAFDAGSAKLTKAEQDKLQKLASALNERPKLTLSIDASVNPQQDSQALAERKLQRQLLQQSGLENLPADFSASRIPASGKLTEALLALYQKQFNVDPVSEKAKAAKAATDDKGKVDNDKLTTLWHIGLYNQLLNAETITDADLGNLAQRRSQAVKAYLVDTVAVAPERVFLLDSKTKLSKTAAQAQLNLSTN